jgi:hypothetical protein
MKKISEVGAGFYSRIENIDTTTPAGGMMMKLVGAFAEFEHAMIPERTSAGLVVEVVVSGQTAAQMARMFGASPTHLSRIIAAHVAGLA